MNTRVEHEWWGMDRQTMTLNQLKTLSRRGTEDAEERRILKNESILRHSTLPEAFEKREHKVD